MNKMFLGAVVTGALVASGSAVAAVAPKAPAAAPAKAHARQPTTRTAVQARVAAMFGKLDANHDGSITKEEMNAVETQRAQKIEQRAKGFDPDKAFTRFDANKDGKITVAELDAARAQLAKAKGATVAPQHATGFTGLFARADANKDNVVTKVEFDAVGQQLKARMEKVGQRQETIGSHMFDTSDANKDGRISLAEMQQVALARFDRADLNHDGKITPDEVKQVRQQSKGQQHAG